MWLYDACFGCVLPIVLLTLHPYMSDSIFIPMEVASCYLLLSSLYTSLKLPIMLVDEVCGGCCIG
jgi:hypothetical protein